MADKTIDQLTELTTLEANDLLIAYDVSELGTEKIRRITKTNAFIGVGGGAGASGSVRRFSDNNPYASSINNASDTSFEVNAHTTIGVGETYGLHWVCDSDFN